MPAALSAAATYTCPHGFPITPTAGAALTIGGSPVAVVGTFTPACTVPDAPSATPPIKHCTSVIPSYGSAAALTVGGQPVVLVSLSLLTDGTPVPPPAMVTPESPAPLTAT